MNGYQVYKMYLGIKMHFNSNTYDYVKYGGGLKASIDTFNKRNDKYFFHKLGNRFKPEDLELYFISNFLVEDNIWIGSLFDEKCKNRFYETKGRHERITYMFEQDVLHLLNRVEKFSDLFKVEVGQHPILIQATLAQDINIETLIIFNELFSCFQKWDEEIDDPVIWPEVRKKCLKYRSFLDKIMTKRKKFVKILHDRIAK